MNTTPTYISSTIGGNCQDAIIVANASQYTTPITLASTRGIGGKGETTDTRVLIAKAGGGGGQEAGHHHVLYAEADKDGLSHSLVKRKRLPCGHRFFADDDREQWARFIQWAMSRRMVEGWFVTLTFKGYVPPPVAEHMCNRWLSRLNKALMDTVGSRLKWVRASEWQSRKVIHFHLILMAWGLHSLSRKSWEVRWEGLGGGFCRIYNAETRAAPYLAKYLNKSRGGELQWGGAWQEGIPSLVEASRWSSESVGERAVIALSRGRPSPSSH